MTRPRTRRVALAAVALVASGLALVAYATDVLRRPELQTVDARFSIRGSHEPPDAIAVVQVDDVSFGDLQRRWPLPRSLHGRLIRRLSAAGAAEIVYDVQFTEPTSIAQDNALISAVAQAGRPVVLATEETNARGESGVFGGERVLRRIGARAGNSTFEPDPGGVYRRVPYETGGLESLSVVAVEELTGEPVDPASFPADGAWIDYYGPPDTITTYSFSKVLDGSVPAEAFDGKTVVVGVSAPTVGDVHPVSTSGDELMAGPEIQANAIATVEHGLPLFSASWPLGAALILVMGFAVPAAGLRLRALPSIGLGLGLAALYTVATQLAFDSDLILPFVYPMAALVLALFGTLGVHYLLEAFERQRVRDTFARFVPELVVGEVLKRADEDLRLGGVRRESTVLFSDLRGFTSFAETIDPDQVVEILNFYLDEMTEAIMGHGGTLVAYMGDGIMAVFGAPVDQEDHADRAVAAAREMLEVRLPRFNEFIREHDLGEGFEMGIGINSGMVMSGQVGSRRRVEYTTIGDTTNTASRLEGMTKGTPHSLFVSDATAKLLRARNGLAFVDELEVRGRREPIAVWTLPARPA